VHSRLALLVLVAATGCATDPVREQIQRHGSIGAEITAKRGMADFVDAPSKIRKEVWIRSVYDTEANVMWQCRLRNGAIATKAPGCSWPNNDAIGSWTVLTTEPAGFNDLLPLVIKGHEVHHAHGGEHY
jgi:hypothetical protein